VSLIEDEDPVCQAFLGSLDQATPPELVRQLAPYLEKLSEKSQEILARRLLPVADEKLARTAVRILLAKPVPANQAARRNRQSLLALIRKFRHLPSTEEVIGLAVHLNSCMNAYPGWKRTLGTLAGPRYVKPAVKALSSAKVGGALKEHLRRYFARCGPAEWAVAADSWSKFRAEDRKALVDLLRGNEKFRRWLAEGVKTSGNDGMVGMARTYNNGLAEGDPAIAIPTTLAEAGPQ
jgi:hypothetical protein